MPFPAQTQLPQEGFSAKHPVLLRTLEEVSFRGQPGVEERQDAIRLFLVRPTLFGMDTAESSLQRMHLLQSQASQQRKRAMIHSSSNSLRVRPRCPSLKGARARKRSLITRLMLEPLEDRLTPAITGPSITATWANQPRRHSSGANRRTRGQFQYHGHHDEWQWRHLRK